jgi:hypothetical protein
MLQYRIPVDAKCNGIYPLSINWVTLGTSCNLTEKFFMKFWNLISKTNYRATQFFNRKEVIHTFDTNWNSATQCISIAALTLLHYTTIESTTCPMKT